MFVNLLVLIVVIAITIFLGRLTVRAVKAQRLWVKIAGGLGAGLLTLLFVLLSYGGVRGFLHLYFAGAEPAPDFTVEGTPKQIARGEYLVNISCVGCHGANDSQQLPLTGGADVAATAGFGFVGRIVTANLTPGGKLADYTDGEIFRAIRRGVDKTGHTLSFMSFSPFNQLSDDDIKAIIAHLRSLPADPGTGPGGDELNYLGMVLFGANLFPAPEPISGVVTAPPAGPTADYGRYVATFGDCRSCHGADMTGTPATSFSPAFPNPRPFVGALTLEQFIQMMRTGVRPNGTPFADGMPWRNASKMTDDDLSALYVYLTKAP